MQYGSIGWAVGATLGYAMAVAPQRVIACIGDGSFQVWRYVLLGTRKLKMPIESGTPLSCCFPSLSPFNI